jgi:hypothetical protein
MTQYQFRDTEFMTAREKELVLRAWVRFLEQGLRFEDFSRRLYEHLREREADLAEARRLLAKHGRELPS